MAQQNEIKFALEFPQGRILCTQNQGMYFLPWQSAEAFMVWGEHKELFGKHAVSMRQDNQTTKIPYSVVYEFSDAGALTDARLVTQKETIRGSLVDAATVQSLNAALANDTIKLYSTRDMQPDSVYNVAKFDDGRLLIQLSGKNELYLGKPDTGYEKLDAHLYMQGGCSMYYKMTATGETIELPWGLGGPRRGEDPKFKGEKLAWVENNSHDPAAFGLDLFKGIVALNPFSEGLPAKPQAKPQGPQAPKL
jgi:hypothetical protein